MIFTLRKKEKKVGFFFLPVARCWTRSAEDLDWEEWDLSPALFLSPFHSLSHFTHSLFSLPLSPLSSSGSGWSLSSVQSLRAPLTSWAGFFRETTRSRTWKEKEREDELQTRTFFLYSLSPFRCRTQLPLGVLFSGHWLFHFSRRWGGVGGGMRRCGGRLRHCPLPSSFIVLPHRNHHPSTPPLERGRGGRQRASFPASMKHPEPSHKEKKKKEKKRMDPGFKVYN